VFLLYPIVAGLVVGLLAGGSLAGLEAARLRWVPLAVGVVVVQTVIFATPVAGWIGAMGPTVYVLTTALVVLVAALNLRQPGFLLVVAGGAANLAAILANGGYMPADPAALSALGWSGSPGTGYSNSIVGGSGVALWPLTDIFAMPTWLPGANVFSIGDVLIGAGAFIWLVVTLRRGRPAST
jgi:hypothetical protein